MTLASAPGKIILFGEHAVVSGAVALGGAVDLRARAIIEDLPGSLLISANNLILSGFSLDKISDQITSDETYAIRYVLATLRKYDAKDISIKIESQIPLAAGMGSSAAVIVATVAALNSHLGLGLDTEDIAKDSHKIEKEVQQGLASRMDTGLATYGGHLLVSSGGIEPIVLPSLEIVVGDTGIPHDTRVLVEKVQELKERYPDTVGSIFKVIGAISASSVPLIREGRLQELGELMNVNHGLLEALGVGCRELSELVYAARGAGQALGAKLTGAGGGGCMIALPEPEQGESLMVALQRAGGMAYSVKTGCEGVRIEESK